MFVSYTTVCYSTVTYSVPDRNPDVHTRGLLSDFFLFLDFLSALQYLWAVKTIMDYILVFWTITVAMAVLNEVIIRALRGHLAPFDPYASLISGLVLYHKHFQLVFEGTHSLAKLCWKFSDRHEYILKLFYAVWVCRNVLKPYASTFYGRMYEV